MATTFDSLSFLSEEEKVAIKNRQRQKPEAYTQTNLTASSLENNVSSISDPLSFLSEQEKTAIKNRQRATSSSTKSLEEVKPPSVNFEKEFGFDELSKKPELFEVIKDAQKVRRNKVYKEGESKEEFVKDFMDDMRFTDWNTALGTVSELAYIKNAPAQDAAKAALAQRVFKNTKSMFQEGGQGGFRPYFDTLFAVATDPASYFGFGVGKAVTAGAAKIAASAATKEAAEQGLKSVARKAAGVSAVTEGAIGGIGAYTQQRLDQATATALGEEAPKLDIGELAVVSLFSAAVSGVGSYKAVSKDPSKYIGKLDAAIKSRSGVSSSIAQPPTQLEQAVIDPVRDNMDNVVMEMSKLYGKQITDEIDPAAVLTDSKVKTELVRTSVQAAFNIIRNNPEFMPKPGETAMSALSRTLANSDALDGTFIEAGLQQMGKSKEEFARMFVSTQSEAGRTLGSMGIMGKWMQALKGLDPAFEKQFNSLYGKDDEYVTGFAKAMDFVKRGETESKAWVTSGLDTLTRNAAGTTLGITAQSAAQLLEGFTYAIGAGVRDAVTGKGFGRSKKIIADSFADALGTWKYLKDGGLATEAADEILKFNPTVRDTLFSALQETGNKEISKVGRWANTLNVAVDGLFRRASFTASVEKQLRDQGMDMYTDFLAKNKAIPTAVVKRAMDDALKTTFSYAPKHHNSTKRGFETMSENAASSLIKTIEDTPFSSLAIPFPRFMANAMAFQYKYSPVGWAGIGNELQLAKAADKAGDLAKAAMHTRQANMKFAQGSVGFAALGAAVQYRKDNQQDDWYNVKGWNGSVIDTRAIFPLAPYFAVADFWVKLNKDEPAKTAEAFQAVVGIKMPAGSQNVFLDQLINAMSSEKEADAAAVAGGKVLGDFIGRFTQPFIVKQGFDILDLFRKDGTIARDPNVIEGEGFGAFGEAAGQRLMSKLPIAKEALPEASARLKEGDVIYKEGEFFNRLFATRTTPAKTNEEKEITSLNLNPYSLYGPSSGNKEFDNTFIRKANKETIPIIKEVMADLEYNKLSLAEKKIVMSEAVRKTANVVRREVMDDMQFTPEKEVQYNKIVFNKLPLTHRKLINEYYKRENGVSLEEANDYNSLYDYQSAIKDLPAFSVGGVVEQTNKALGI